jgi:hypothetical protein
MQVQFQSQKFDLPGRLFWSIQEIVDAIYALTACDVGQAQAWECPSEFFTLWPCLVNENKFDLGRRDSDVKLPNWARSPYHFVTVMRLALESEQVSRMIRSWIDRIFGQSRCNCLYPRWAYPEDDFRDPDGNVSRTEEYGSLPRQLFEIAHPQRGELKRREFYCSHGFTSPLLGMAKGFIVCRDSSLFDIKRNTSVLLPRRKYMDLFGISRSLRISVFGLGSDSGLVCISFNGSRSNILGQLGSIITCAAVVGGEFLITGGGDCAIHIYELPEHVPVSQPALHSAPLIAIAGNLDLGMIASIDNDFYLVLETLFDHKFINFASIPRAAKKPLLTVFKSGVVVVAHDQFISFFDARAQLMTKIEEARDIIQIE